MTGSPRGFSLTLDAVTFAYPETTEPVLCDCSWEVPSGAFALLVGGTGSGKSTLLSLCRPQISPAGELSGSIIVDGRDVREFSDAESARSIGYVFQDPDNQIVCESVWHEMAFGLENLGTPQDEMRRLVAETSYFFGMEDWFRAQTDTLSGGRKQLLALASTLVMQPRLLLLDEPTAQLDPIAEKNFLHALFRVNRELGCTVVVATHRPQAMIDYATCAYELCDGHVDKIADMTTLSVRSTLLESESSEGTGVAKPVASSAINKDALAVKGAWFRYDRNASWVLRGLDLRVSTGQVHALVGGNGCGKSTLLSALAGATKLRRGKAKRASASVVLLPQDPRALFVAETALDELQEGMLSTHDAASVRTVADARAFKLGRAAAGVRAAKSACITETVRTPAEEMLHYLGISDCGNLHPYDLSGGQRQLLALGKLLLPGPDILLLDEPTKGLDIEARRTVARVLRDRARAGCAVLMATHDLDFAAQVADVVSMMFDGEIACTQPTDEFFSSNVYYLP